MTASEKGYLLYAFTELRNGNDKLLDDIAEFHGDNFGDIHNNNVANDVFLAWHRMVLFELEQAMQNINGKISIPFWYWPEDNTTSSPLWSSSFMGLFDSPWGLNRNLGGGGVLPSVSTINTIQAETNWDTYTDNLESSSVHTGPHNWVGGTMATGTSPADPIFFLHHGMIDNLWQDWVLANGVTSTSNIYDKTDMPRYDGTYTFDGNTLPSVNPDNIVDSKSLGVFFADNGLAELYSYSVSNNYHAQEVFYYQYKIEAKNNFTVPNGKNAKVESVNEIILKPGFSAITGSTFVAKIDQDNDLGTERFMAQQAVQNLQKNLPTIEIAVLPNPNNGIFTINNKSDEIAISSIEIIDVIGRVVTVIYNPTSSVINMDISTEKNGIYLVKIITANNRVITQRIIKQ